MFSSKKTNNFNFFLSLSEIGWQKYLHSIFCNVQYLMIEGYLFSLSKHQFIIPIIYWLQVIILKIFTPNPLCNKTAIELQCKNKNIKSENYKSFFFLSNSYNSKIAWPNWPPFETSQAKFSFHNKLFYFQSWLRTNKLPYSSSTQKTTTIRKFEKK